MSGRQKQPISPSSGVRVQWLAELKIPHPTRLTTEDTTSPQEGFKEGAPVAIGDAKMNAMSGIRPS